MGFWTDLLLVLLGMGLLFGGGEFLVRGAVSAARRFGVSELVIGLTIVGFATSTPELLVSVQAALKGSPEIAIGNVVGSNIANILLIGGFTALIASMVAPDGELKRDLRVMLASSALILPAAAWGAIPRLGGLLLVALLAVYLYAHFRAARHANAKPDSADGPDTTAMDPLWRSVALVIGGIVMLVLGADWLVDGASSIARAAGISDAVVGLTVVAIGTSLPELATSIVAAWRGRPGVALGNVVGSNIFNVLGILGATAIIAPLPIATRFLWFDLPLMMAISIGFAAVLTAGDRLGKTAGGLMLAGYAVYTAVLFLTPM
ncbi:calcium/sodium antiporter [Aquibium oceanicum]|uniref:Sodium:calcium antiporter n=1 Tax=Aquibium oceanicum TaxID=1670800 RepID=A0A1L3SR22_9HYPH|nr:calcium/sodium antiporter [Aquibium oceanicum]APH71775.1 sodium:calcium antiporter [Aquibium oceanicum]